MGCLCGLGQSATNNSRAKSGSVLLVQRSSRDHLSAQWLAPISKRPQLHIADEGTTLDKARYDSGRSETKHLRGSSYPIVLASPCVSTTLTAFLLADATPLQWTTVGSLVQKGRETDYVDITFSTVSRVGSAKLPRE